MAFIPARPAPADREDFETPNGHFRLVLDRTAPPKGRFMLSPKFDFILPGYGSGVTIPDAVAASIESLKAARAEIDAKLAELDAMLREADGTAINRDGVAR